MSANRQRIFKRLLIGLGLTLFINSAQGALLLRNLGGGNNNAVYDSVLDITWLADANLAVSNNFGVSGFLPDGRGRMNWFIADSWIKAMNADGGTGYLGVNTWRLPTVSPVDGISFDATRLNFDGSTDRGYQLSAPVDETFNPNGKSAGFTGSELAYHYYNNLGAIGECSLGNNDDNCVLNTIFGIRNATKTADLSKFENIDNIDNLVNFPYWTGTELAPGSPRAFFFDVRRGLQDASGKNSNAFVWPVAPGDVAVPVPAAVWLLGSALLGLVGFRKRQRSHQTLQLSE